MKFTEIIRMALGSLGVNKLRSSLTMLGITIGVFSVIGVMTAIGALRQSIETGLSFLGSNIIQVAKRPIGLSDEGANRRRYDLRRDITLAEAQRFKELMEGWSDTICLKTFNNDTLAQATYLNRKTTPSITFGGTNEHFLTANQYAVELGRNFTAEDVDLIRPVALIGQGISSHLFPSESPLGKIIKVSSRTYTVIGLFAAKGSSFGASGDDIVMIPITRYLADYGAEKRSINIATQAFSQERYNDTLDKVIMAMRIAMIKIGRAHV